MMSGISSDRALQDSVRHMAEGLKPGLVTQLTNLARDLHVARVPDSNVIAIVRPLIEEIRKETR